MALGAPPSQTCVPCDSGIGQGVYIGPPPSNDDARGEGIHIGPPPFYGDWADPSVGQGIHIGPPPIFGDWADPSVSGIGEGLGFLKYMNPIAYAASSLRKGLVGYVREQPKEDDVARATAKLFDLLFKQYGRNPTKPLMHRIMNVYKHSKFRRANQGPTASPKFV